MSATKILLLLLALLCSFHPSPLCEAAVCYVMPTEPHNATCPSEPCYTLDEYVSNSTLSSYFASNTVFKFLNGYHNLSHRYLQVCEVHNLTLKPYVEEGSVVIYSDVNATVPMELNFDNVSAVVIERMTCKNFRIVFDNCTDITLMELTVIDDNDVYASISLSNVFGLVNLSKISLQSSSIEVGIEWRATQSPASIPYTQVLLHELNITGYRTCGVCLFSSVPLEKLLTVLTNSSLINHVVGMYAYLVSNRNDVSFVFKNTLFSGNYIGLYISPQHDFTEYYDIALYNVSYIDNEFIAAWLINARNATIKDCNFKGSQHGGAIRTSDSSLFFVGDVTFVNNHNTAIGGAISLFGSSFISIPKPDSTYVLFENNTASDVGGAIYFQKLDFHDKNIHNDMPDCRIYLPEPIHNTNVFNFTMNKAANGGNAIYGANLEQDCVTPSATTHYNLSHLILSVSSFSPSFDRKHSVVSSDPQSLRFCDRDRECGTGNITGLSVYPGEVFELSVALLGDMRGFVRYPLYVTVDSGEINNPLQYTQAESCKNLSYSIFSSRAPTNISMIFYFGIGITSTCTYSMSLRDCPLGFILSAKQLECVCNEKLLSIGNITCNITEQTIHRQGTTWIGSLEENSGNVSAVFSSTCPFNYCYRSSVKVHVSDHHLDEDIQCTGNRTGLLCGHCRDNFSLALGSNRCLHGCSNYKLSLTIVFAAAGIALVFFIKILNLTISQGTVDGLILYANIVWVELSPSVASKGLTSFLSIFLAWLNLDLGVETCFFTGMTAYAKAWLQFVFPVYVWTIALFIIILSHYSLRASRLFGNNSVPVLATLVLLFYSKLLRASLSAISFTRVHFLNGSTMLVWEKDGSIHYLTGKHIPLFVFALAVIVLLWLPFTLTLVSIQWLQKGTHYRVLCWVAKLKPFFDAFTGPLKDKHRYWVGTLLLVRCILCLISFIYTANGERVALLAINIVVTIMVVLLAATGSVYRNFLLTILLLSYLFNLGIVVAGTLYSFDKEKSQTLVTISVGITFVQFVATVIYHAGMQLKEPLKKLQLKELLKKLQAKIRRNNVANDEDIEHTVRELEESSALIEPPLIRANFQDFRESLLAYLTD